MNETRRIALEFAMRIATTDAQTVLEIARQFEAYLTYPETINAVSMPLHDMAIRMFSDSGARP